MRYVEFRFPWKGEDKRLGVFGETHIFNRDECHFARHVVNEFDVYAEEPGISNGSATLTLAGILDAPIGYAIRAGTGRWCSRDCALSEVEERGATVAKLETQSSKSFNAAQKAAILAITALGLPFLPLQYTDLKLNGDPYTDGTRASYLRKMSGVSRVVKHVAAAATRDRQMLSTISSTLDAKNNLLVFCGEGHGDGLIDYVQQEWTPQKVVDIRANVLMPLVDQYWAEAEKRICPADACDKIHTKEGGTSRTIKNVLAKLRN